MKFLLGIALALGIAAAAYAAAAALIVDGGVVQYGADLNLTCTASVKASATTLGATDPQIDNISITFPDAASLAACSTQKIRIGLTGTGGSYPWEAYNAAFNPDPVTADGFVCYLNPLAICFPHPPVAGRTAANLTDIHVTFYSE